MIARRRVVLALGAGALAPLQAVAQQASKARRIGFLTPLSRQETESAARVFTEGLRALGHVEGRNLVIEWRYADGNAERLPALAADLVRSQVEAIVVQSSPGIRAAIASTSTIPIIMAATGDPAASGLVAGLAHPGGNVTGLSNAFGDFIGKHVEMLKAVMPALSRVAVLGYSGSSTFPFLMERLSRAAESLKVTPIRLEARTPEDIERRFADMAKARAEALFVVHTSFFQSQRRLIVTLAAKQRLPWISTRREYALDGALMTYGPDTTDNFRRVAPYVDRILKGAKPSELPIEQPTKFELLINRKTANALGLKIPQDLLVRADEVIE